MKVELFMLNGLLNNNKYILVDITIMIVIMDEIEMIKAFFFI